MSTIKLFLTAALACLPIAAAQSAATPVPASVPESPETIEARSRNTNLMLLQGLVERRDALAKSIADKPVHRAAIDFLDQRIAELAARLGK